MVTTPFKLCSLRGKDSEVPFKEVVFQRLGIVHRSRVLQFHGLSHKTFYPLEIEVLK